MTTWSAEPRDRWSAEPRDRTGRRLQRLLAIAVVAIAWVWAPVTLLAAGAEGDRSGPEKREDVLSRQRQLQSLKAEIDANRREIGRLRAREADVAEIAKRIDRDRTLTLRYLRELEAQETDLRDDLGERQVELFDMEATAEGTAARLKKAIVRYYKIRELAGPELLLSSRSFAELFARGHFLARWIDRNRVELAALADERARILQASSAIEQRRRGLATLQDEKRNEADRLKREGAAAQAKLADLQGERARKERHLKELEASQTAIRKMIERMEKERARGGGTPFTGSLEQGRGRLDWPVDGQVITQFGVEVSPRYGTKVPSNGIDIAAPSGTPIRAVARGRAEFVDWLPGYGRTVILNHGSGYYTLYAHASTVEVRKGQTVEAGTVIARVGDTDSIKGECLHFEVREGERALDPEAWLRR